MADITVNGTDLSALGFSMTMPEDWLRAPSVTWLELPLYGRSGSLFSQGHYQSRPFAFEGYIEGDTVAEARSNYDQIVHTIMKSRPATIVLGDQSSRMVLGYLKDMNVRSVGPAFAEPDLYARFEFMAAQPFLYSTTETTVGSIGSGGSAVAQGTGPVWPKVKIQGAVSPGPIVISLKDYSDTQVGTITFTMTLATSSDYLCVDFEKRTAYENQTGSFTSGTNRLDKWTAGSWWHIEPVHSNIISSVWPKIAVSAGTGTAIYTKAYF